jgi:hypothetical protein
VRFGCYKHFRSYGASFFFHKLLPEFSRSPSQLQPIRKQARRLNPDAEPVCNLLLLSYFDWIKRFSKCLALRRFSRFDRD